MRNLISIFLLSLTTLGFAQPYVSKLGRFQVDEIKGCAPLTIKFTNLLAGGCGIRPCAIDFNANIDDIDDGSTTPATYTYTTPGKYLVKVIYQNQDNQVDEIEINVVANTDPTFDIYACSGNGVQVKVTDTKYDQYFIDYGDGSNALVAAGSLAKGNHTYLSAGAKTIGVKGINLNAANNCVTARLPFTAAAALPSPIITSVNSLTSSETEINYTINNSLLGRLEIATNNNATFQQLKPVYKDNRDTIRSINNETNYYCFRLGVVDACSNTMSSYSTSVCSIVLTATAKDGFNELNWKNDAGGITSYTVKRDDQNNFSTGVTPASISFRDLNITCNVEYCYQLKAIYAGASSTSLTKCVTSFTTKKPATITDQSVTFNDQDEIELTWKDQPEAVDYSIYKKANDPAYTLASQQADPPYVDKAVDISTPSCYEIIYKDKCNNSSDTSAETCPVFLSASLADDNTITLTWNNYQGWSGGVAGYRVERYTQNGLPLNVYEVGNTTTFTDDDSKDDLINQAAYYRIIAVAKQFGVAPSKSNRVLVIKKPNLFYPTTFTPNGDNLNDKFKVFGQFIAGIDFKIFNRWGELVFSTTNIKEGWDGTYKGTPQQEGTYAFIAEITDFAGRKVKQKGAIMLLKKNKE